MENEENSYGNGIFAVVKGTLLALAISLLCAVLLAALLRATTMTEKTVYAINQVIKLLSIIAGAWVFVRGEKGWLKGGGIALAFTSLSYLAFAALGGDFSLSWLLFAELAAALFTGALTGALAVNRR